MRGMKVVKERPPFPEKLRAEKHVPPRASGLYALRKAHRDRGFDDDGGLWVQPRCIGNHRFHGAVSKKCSFRVVVRRRGDDDKVGVAVGVFRIEGGAKVQLRAERERATSESSMGD